MAQNKRNIKKPYPPKFSNPQYEKLAKQNEKREARESNFKMKRSTKTRIKAWLAAGALAVSAFQAAKTAYAQSFDETTNLEKTFSLGTVDNGAEINDGGQKHLIDPNSIVILSENNALAFDENGIIHKGNIDSSQFKEIITMTEDEISDYNIYKVDIIDGANVRASGSAQEDNIISAVPFGDYVLGLSTNTDEYDGEWISTLSINESNICEGYIREDLIREVGNLDLIYDNVDDTLVKVDTSKDGNINLNLRTSPGQLDKRFIMTTLPNGSILRVTGEEEKVDNKTWVQVEYDAGEGYMMQGWVASDYLQPYFSQEKSISQSQVIHQSQEFHQINENTINTNATGNVTGIDISSLSPNALRELLDSGLPRGVSSEFGDVDISKLAGDINFVYIKLGASSYGNGDFSILNYNTYEEQVKVCEELGIPYGFYYYSTSTTVEEANIELQHIHQKIENLRSKIDIKHNNLDMVVDVELAGKQDRQYQGNIHQHTEAKATLINGIQESGISDDVLIYGPMRVMKSDLDQIFSLSDLHSMLSNPDNVNLWLCARANQKGQLPSSFESDVAYVQNCGFDTVMTQVVLDANVGGRIDIDNMNIEHYQKLIEHNREIVQLDEYDDER